MTRLITIDKQTGKFRPKSRGRKICKIILENDK